MLRERTKKSSASEPAMEPAKVVVITDGWKPQEQLAWYTGPPGDTLSRDAEGRIKFPDCPTFQPNLTPKEIMQAGSFGGYYFRDIYSSVTRTWYRDAWREFPAAWFAGLPLKQKVCNPKYNAAMNTYAVKCGQDLPEWESSGWIVPQDPYGWFYWYCRFYLGRRSPDDERQIARWLACAGPTGRWRGNLITKVFAAGAAFDDRLVSPVVRQTLQHWAYVLNPTDLKLGIAKIQKRGKLLASSAAEAPAASKASKADKAAGTGETARKRSKSSDQESATSKRKK